VTPWRWNVYVIACNPAAQQYVGMTKLLVMARWGRHISDGHCQINFCGGDGSTKRNMRSRCGNRISPLIRHLGSEDPERRARDEMALRVEGVVDGGVHAEETQGGASRLEPLHFALSSSHCLMRVFGSIVRPEPLLMRASQS
jgi:hypothetical protein